MTVYEILHPIIIYLHLKNKELKIVFLDDNMSYKL